MNLSTYLEKIFTSWETVKIFVAILSTKEDLIWQA